MKNILLEEICTIYQPKTISQKEMKEDGEYLVFGANGVIGKYDKYNHEESEVVITCRGATCGTVNYTSPRSWITGNAMVVSPKNGELNKRYLFYCLKNTNLDQAITGTAQPQITRTNLKNIKINIPELTFQEKIVIKLDKIKEAIESKKASFKDCDKLIYSVYKKSTEENVTDVKKLSEIGETLIGLTYSPKDISEVGTIVLRSGNIQDGQLDFSDILRVSKIQKDNKYVRENDILICSRNGSKRLVGKAAIIPKLNEKMFFGAFMAVYRSEYNKYLLAFFHSNDFRNQLGESSTATINQITSKMLNNMDVKLPSQEIMRKVISKFEKIEKQKELLRRDIEDLELLYETKMHEYFD